MRLLLIAKDTGQYINWFPQGIAYVAAVLLEKGYKIEVYHQNVHHYPDEHLANYFNNNYFDVVGVGAIGGYYQYRQLLTISHAINSVSNRPVFCNRLPLTFSRS